MSDLTITTVHSSMINIIWDKVEPLIKMVEQKSPEDIVSEVTKQELIKGNLVLATISRGSDIIAIHVLDVRTLDSGTKILYIPIIAGSEMELWMDDFLEILVAIAKNYGCAELRGLAVRDGWLRKLKPYGWEEIFTTIRYKIGE